MARPLRIEIPGGLYHITSRGDRREPIYNDDTDRRVWLDLLGQVCERFHWHCHAWCQMTNHYHLLVETAEPTLSRGMRHLNGVFTQWSNRRYERTGHLFQGRFHAILVQREAHLLELCRYIVLNPVRASMVNFPDEWPWSSWHATVGTRRSPAWLNARGLLKLFNGNGGDPAANYRQFVLDGIGKASPMQKLSGQVILGTETYIQEILQRAKPAADEVPRSQSLAPPRPLASYFQQTADTSQAMRAAYATGHYTLREIAQHAGVHYSTVSRAVRNRAKA